MLVPTAARKILDEALALPEEDRRRLGELLLDSVSPEPSAEVERAWRDEVLRRVEQVRAGELTPEPWSEVKKRIDEALGR